LGPERLDEQQEVFNRHVLKSLGGSEVLVLLLMRAQVVAVGHRKVERAEPFAVDCYKRLE